MNVTVLIYTGAAASAVTGIGVIARVIWKTVHTIARIGEAVPVLLDMAAEFQGTEGSPSLRTVVDKLAADHVKLAEHAGIELDAA